MKRTPKKAATKKAELDQFQIDDNPPPFSRQGRVQNLELIAKLERTIPSWKVGSAIVVDAKKRNSVAKYLRTNYAGDRWGVMKIPDNTTQVRVYRLKLK